MRRALEHGAVGFIPKSSDAATIGHRDCRRARRRPLGAAAASTTCAAWRRREPTSPSASATSRRSSSACCGMLGSGLLNKQIALRTGRVRSHDQGAHDRHPAQARRQQPHPGGAAGRQAGGGSRGDGRGLATPPALRARSGSLQGRVQRRLPHSAASGARAMVGFATQEPAPCPTFRSPARCPTASSRACSTPRRPHAPACDAVVFRAGLQASQVKLITPAEPHPNIKLQPEGAGIWRTIADGAPVVRHRRHWSPARWPGRC